MSVTRVLVQVRDGYRFTRMPRPGTEYSVEEADTDAYLGSVWKTGSRFRMDAWHWRSPNARSGYSSSRTDAANALWNVACEDYSDEE